MSGAGWIVNTELPRIETKHAIGVSFEFVVIVFFAPFAHGGCMEIVEASNLFISNLKLIKYKKLILL